MSLFDGMRHSTPEEQEAFEHMIEGMGDALVPESEVLALKSENAMLREHLANVLPFAICSDTCFVGNCFMYQECKDDVTGTCHAITRMKELARELVVYADYDRRA